MNLSLSSAAEELCCWISLHLLSGTLRTQPPSSLPSSGTVAVTVEMFVCVRVGSVENNDTIVFTIYIMHVHILDTTMFE